MGWHRDSFKLIVPALTAHAQMLLGVETFHPWMRILCLANGPVIPRGLSERCLLILIGPGRELVALERQPIGNAAPMERAFPNG
jgi:hypothetical protein